MERVAGKRKSSFCYPFFFFVALERRKTVALGKGEKVEKEADHP